MRDEIKPSKTSTLIVFWSCTMHPQSPPLIIGETVLKESDDFKILGVTFKYKITFEKHLHSISTAASHGLVSIGNPGEYLMIDYSLNDASGVLS